MMGNAPYPQFLAEHPGITLLSFGEAAAAADGVVINGIDGHNAVAGDHADAKQQATNLLKVYGWSDILDLGPLVCARGMEMYAHMHSAIGFGLGQQFGGHFGIKVVR